MTSDSGRDIEITSMSSSETKGCCLPRRTQAALNDPVSTSARGILARRPHSITQCPVPAQIFSMGDEFSDGYPPDGEVPLHKVSLDAFSIDATTVTNRDFADFVADTDFKTDAERFGNSLVFHASFDGDAADVIGAVPQTPWWLVVRHACWRHPQGKQSIVDGLQDHPVVHVSWNDALAYCEWANRSLPTEAQWEAAARGGMRGFRFPWGNELTPVVNGREAHQANVWQGRFPTSNTAEDGFEATAPVRTYFPNPYGLWQMIGNVWEWCADFWSRDTYQEDAQRWLVQEPRGPATGRERVMRGGSFLCHESYCNRYRNAARSYNTPDSSSSNVGFRTVGRRSINTTSHSPLRVSGLV